MKSKRLLVMALLLVGAAAGTVAMMAASAPKKGKKGNIEQKTAQSPSPEWIDQAVIYEANLRQGTPTRDFKGLQRELPRLKDLGVDIVWLMPVHPISEVNRKGTLGSYYAVRDYKDVNPEFGTIQDLKELVSTAHNLGMKVILDEVCNHTGCDNAWVTEHPDYYAKDKDGKMFGPFDWTDTYKLDYSNPATRQAMTDALLFWIREADIDGYRCDVAGEVPTDFWEEVRPKLQAVKPVFMLAEASKPELLEKGFDVDYAWPMKDLFNAIAATAGANSYAKEKGQKLEKKRAVDIPKLIARHGKEYPKGAVHMNMVTNHDLNSWEGTEFERYGDGLGAFAVLSYTLPGIPMMYTGQEVGFNHPFEFFERDEVQPDYRANEMTAFYKMLNALKHKHPALATRGGDDTMTVYGTTSDDLLVFSRDKGDDRVVVLANLSGAEVPVKFLAAGPQVEGLTDYFGGGEAKVPDTLAPWQYIVLTK